MRSCIAEPSITTSGPPRREPWAWMVRATSALPVPESPVMSTGASLDATMLMRVARLLIGGDLVTRAAPVVRATNASRAASNFFAIARRSSSGSTTDAMSSSTSNGLAR